MARYEAVQVNPDWHAVRDTATGDYVRGEIGIVVHDQREAEAEAAYLNGPAMLDLDNTEFGTVLVSPDRKRFAYVDSGADDAGAYFAWVLPVDKPNGRRVRLYFGEANGWMALAEADASPETYIAYLFGNGTRTEVIFKAPYDEWAKSHVVVLIAEHGASGYDLHRVRPQSAVEADCAARKSTVPLAVRVK